MSEVFETDASFAVFFLRSVASTDCGKELLLTAAVESTDRSLSHLVACQACSLFDGTKGRRWRPALDGVRDQGLTDLSL